MIKAENIAFESGNRKIVHPTSIDFSKSEMVVILGPNGAGKSTLLQLLAGLFKPTSGVISYHGKRIGDWKINELAKYRSFLHQQNTVFGSFTVRDVIEMGRYPYFNEIPTQEDLQMVNKMVVDMGFTARENQPYQTLSGGEQQRVQFARAILQLQETATSELTNKVLFLDEPLNNLDLKYQYLLMEQAKSTIVEKGGAVIAVLHDFNMAYQFADRILIVKEGNLVVDETVNQAMNPQVLSSIFDIDVQRIELSQKEVFFHTKSKKELTKEENNFNKVQSYN